MILLRFHTIWPSTNQTNQGPGPPRRVAAFKVIPRVDVARVWHTSKWLRPSLHSEDLLGPANSAGTNLELLRTTPFPKVRPQKTVRSQSSLCTHDIHFRRDERDRQDHSIQVALITADLGLH
ncbi:hypothetical protein MN608_01208 [Microdochium nivale]|nr:hypothetical protein MN608_01208 [Microdochium nivale]